MYILTVLTLVQPVLSHVFSPESPKLGTPGSPARMSTTARVGSERYSVSVTRELLIFNPSPSFVEFFPERAVWREDGPRAFEFPRTIRERWRVIGTRFTLALEPTSHPHPRDLNCTITFDTLAGPLAGINANLLEGIYLSQGRMQLNATLRFDTPTTVQPPHLWDRQRSSFFPGTPGFRRQVLALTPPGPARERVDRLISVRDRLIRLLFEIQYTHFDIREISCTPGAQ